MSFQRAESGLHQGVAAGSPFDLNPHSVCIRKSAIIELYLQSTTSGLASKKLSTMVYVAKNCLSDTIVRACAETCAIFSHGKQNRTSLPAK